MRACSAALATDIANECTTLARLWRVTRQDGTVLHFTDSTRPIVYSGDTYRSDVTFTASAIYTTSVIANAQSVQFTVQMADDAISENDVRARLWQAALGEVMLINYETPAHGVMTLFKGTFGRIVLSDKKVCTIEILPLSSALAGRSIGNEVYSPTCRASLGDARCGFDIEGAKVAFTVDSAGNATFTAPTLTQTNNYWVQGFVLWSTGANAGTRSMVNSSVQATKRINLVSATQKAIAVGDTGFVYPGCDKTSVTCRDRFNRIPFMRAEPFVPGQDIISQLPVGGVSSSGKGISI